MNFFKIPVLDSRTMITSSIWIVPDKSDHRVICAHDSFPRKKVGYFFFVINLIYYLVTIILDYNSFRLNYQF